MIREFSTPGKILLSSIHRLLLMLFELVYLSIRQYIS